MKPSKIFSGGRTYLRSYASVFAVFFIFTLFTGFSAVAAESPAREKMLVPIGRAAGIKLLSEGVIVVGLSNIETTDGEASPAKNAGLETGDIILKVEGVEVNTVEELQTALQKGGELTLDIRRSGKELRKAVTPQASASDGHLRLGAWVRDSMAGIGTITFFDPESKVFGALGHGVNDVDTSILMPIRTGTLMKAMVESVRLGAPGAPGELRGSFDFENTLGTIYKNTDRGIFGTLDIERLGLTRDAMPIAPKREILTGPATILSNVSGDAVEEYAISIKKIHLLNDNSQRNMTIEVTDERLIEKTGGIVQGMSGSPILQNGKIVGAVTHVLIGDPTKGYGIFVENMLKDAEAVLK